MFDEEPRSLALYTSSIAMKIAPWRRPARHDTSSPLRQGASAILSFQELFITSSRGAKGVLLILDYHTYKGKIFPLPQPSPHLSCLYLPPSSFPSPSPPLPFPTALPVTSSLPPPIHHQPLHGTRASPSSPPHTSFALHPSRPSSSTTAPPPPRTLHRSRRLHGI